MRIVRADVLPYTLPLREPAVWNGARRAEREGALLRLEAASGAVGWGDAAPLPGFSRETLAEATDTLRALGAELSGRDLEADAMRRPDGPLHAALDGAGLPSSARFALDLALADLAAQDAGTTLPQGLHPDPAVTLPVNALLRGTPDALPERAAALAAGGYATLKLKVGRGRPDADARLVAAVRQRVGPDVALRLDANRAWSVGAATRFAEAVREAGVSYVEEPLADPAGLAALWLDTGLPVALDETLQEPGAEVHGWAAAAVLKPTLVGGLWAALRLAARARRVGVQPVLSAAFESGVGLRGIAALAAATGGAAAGLDTYRWLAADVTGPLPFDRPVVDVPALFARSLDVQLP